ncbi:unnamed protein product [Cunninghamella blakesleeana]
MTSVLINTEIKKNEMGPIRTNNENSIHSNLSSDWQSDNDDDEFSSEDQEQFNRISGILSALIQEANEAIQTSPFNTLKNSTHHNMEQDTDYHPYINNEEDEEINQHHHDLLLLNMSTSTTIHRPNRSNSLTTNNNNYLPSPPKMTSSYSSSASNLRRPSRLPRPKRLSFSTLSYPMNRQRSFSNLSTTSSLSSMVNDDDRFSCTSTELTTPMSRTTSPLFEKSMMNTMNHHQDHVYDEPFTLIHHHDNKNDNKEGMNHHYHDSLLLQEKSLSPTDPLLASFERLDSSLALVDSLSRDLANHRNANNTNNNNNNKPQHSRTPSSTSISIPNHLDESDDPFSYSNTNNHSTATTTLITTPNKNTIQKNASSSSSKWAFFLLFPLVHIPYVLFTMILDGASSTTKSSSSASASSPTSTSQLIIDQRILSPLAGLSVFILLMSIIHLVTNSNNNTNNNTIQYNEYEDQDDDVWYQHFKEQGDYDDEIMNVMNDVDEWMSMIKMERRSSLPNLSTSSSSLLQLQRRNSN